jgi:hypothetical protein
LIIMQYLMAVYGPAEMGEFGNYPDQATMDAAMAETGRFNDKLQAEGHFVYANGLASATAATVVDGRGETPLITDGPYLESKEHLGGFWIIEADDLDQALALAAEGSKACGGKVEVRPFQSVTVDENGSFDLG